MGTFNLKIILKRLIIVIAKIGFLMFNTIFIRGVYGRKF
jgi:hypothetical protein